MVNRPGPADAGEGVRHGVGIIFKRRSGPIGGRLEIRVWASRARGCRIGRSIRNTVLAPRTRRCSRRPGRDGHNIRVGELELTHIFTGHTRNDQNRTRLEASRHPVNIILAAAKECQLCDTSGHMASARIIGIVHSGDDT